MMTTLVVISLSIVINSVLAWCPSSSNGSDLEARQALFNANNFDEYVFSVQLQEYGWCNEGDKSSGYEMQTCYHPKRYITVQNDTVINVQFSDGRSSKCELCDKYELKTCINTINDWFEQAIAWRGWLYYRATEFEYLDVCYDDTYNYPTGIDEIGDDTIWYYNIANFSEGSVNGLPTFVKNTDFPMFAIVVIIISILYCCSCVGCIGFYMLYKKKKKEENQQQSITVNKTDDNKVGEEYNDYDDNNEYMKEGTVYQEIKGFVDKTIEIIPDKTAINPLQIERSQIVDDGEEIINNQSETVYFELQN